ncbi:MAG: TetR/AcrR family transcriptional regulator [bacterium]|nr:TetR/AcrR family transcriptional regulator [bacterium]
MAPRIIDKEARRKEILKAAMRVSAARGIKNVRIEEIAEAAGVGKGTIYEYFKSKEEIFGASMVEFMQHMEAIMAQKMFRAVTPQDKIKALLYAWDEACENEDSDLMNLMIDVWAEGIRRDNKELLKVIDMKTIYEQLREMVSAILKDGINQGIFRKIDVTTVAGLLLAAFDGIMIQWLLDRENTDLKKSADVLYDTLIHGIINKPDI